MSCCSMLRSWQGYLEGYRLQVYDTCSFIRTCVYVCTYAACVYMHVCMYVCMCVCMYMYIYIERERARERVCEHRAYFGIYSFLVVQALDYVGDAETHGNGAWATRDFLMVDTATPQYLASSSS